jgi:PHP family Zn ribbon phosphoesterase
MEIKKENLIFSDLHIHSKYSRACSKELSFENLVKWAKIKGLSLLGTGDFTHPKWLEEIKKLREENGIYYYDSNESSFPFILSSEISLIYTARGKGRKVHLVYLAPSIEVVDKINSWLDSKGRRDYDGRPIFGISCRD